MQQLTKFRYRILSVIVLVGILCGSFGAAPHVFAQTVPPDRPGFDPEEPLPEAVYAPDRVIVKLAPRMQAATVVHLQSEMGATMLRGFALTGAQLWQVPEGTVAEVVARYADDPRFVYVEPDYQVSISPLASNVLVEGDALAPAAVTPNDPLWDQLWGMRAIAAPTAWETTTGAEVLIGVIDSGVDITHPDLAANIWTNPGEIAGNNVDDDGNGYVDDVHGWDFRNEDNDPQDDYGHGTHVAGTIAAVGNNAEGVVGVNWSAKIVPLKFLGADGTGYTSDSIEAIEYAVAMGVKVTNNSWGGGGRSQVLYDAIAAAEAAGHLFVASAGNLSQNIDVYPVFPASYDRDNVIAVAATDADDQLASFSNYGPLSVDLSAPGVNIVSTVPGAFYMSKEGTSMAAPHVTGVVGLLWSQFPDADFREIKELILKSTDPIAPGHTLSDGRLNAAQALGFTFSPNSFTFNAPLFGMPLTRTLQVGWLRDGARTWQATVAEPWLSVSPVSGTVSAGNPLTVEVSVNLSLLLTAGWYHGAVTFSTASRTYSIPVSVLLSSEPLIAESVKLVPGNAAGGEAYNFGYTVALSGDVAVFGTKGDAFFPYGAAYFYRWTGAAWDEVAYFEGRGEEDPGVDFGHSVALSGDVALVSEDSAGGGVVHVYRWADDTWSKDGTIQAPAEANIRLFGNSVALDGDVALVTAFDVFYGRRSMVYVFRWDGSTWREEAKLELANALDKLHSEFGYALAIDGDVAVIGDPKQNIVYIYHWNGTAWVMQTSVSPGGVVRGFGASVAVSGDRVLVGSPGCNPASIGPEFGVEIPGAAYLYQWNGMHWIRDAKFTHPDSEALNGFGYAVALSGDTALVSAPLSDENETSAGAAYIYHWTGEQWTGEPLDTRLAGSGGLLSRSIALEGSRALLGAHKSDMEVGAAYMYSLPDGGSQIKAALPSLTLTYAESKNLPITVPLTITNAGTEALTWLMLAVPDYVYTQTTGTLAPQEEVTLAMRIENWGGPVVITSNSTYGNVFYLPVEPSILYPYSVHLPMVPRAWPRLWGGW